MYTYKVSNGIQLYNAPRLCCGLLTDDVEHLTNIFLITNNNFTLSEHIYTIVLYRKTHSCYTKYTFKT